MGKEKRFIYNSWRYYLSSAYTVPGTPLNFSHIFALLILIPTLKDTNISIILELRLAGREVCQEDTLGQKVYSRQKGTDSSKAQSDESFI